MADYMGGEYINSVLGGILDGVNKYNARLIPSKEKSLDCVSYWRAGNISAADEFFQVLWQVNVYSGSQATAEDNAQTVKDAFNRTSMTVGDYTYFSIVDILPVIPPGSDQDSFTVPVQILIRRR